MARVIIGVDPHQRSATIEVINEREQTLGQGRFGTDTDGYKAMLAVGRRHKDRQWAVEGCNGIGHERAPRRPCRHDAAYPISGVRPPHRRLIEDVDVGIAALVAVSIC